MTMLTRFNQEGISKIKAENKQFIISKLKTGDLIKTKAETYPLIYHYGIVQKNADEVFIIHNHPDKINSKGGNVVKEPLLKWIKGRDIVSVEKTNLDTNDIENLQDELKKYKYSFINFNCEHFVNFAKDKNYISPQVLRWTTFGIISLTVYFLLKNKKL